MEHADMSQNQIGAFKENFKHKLISLLAMGTEEHNNAINYNKNQALILIAAASLGLIIGIIISLLF